MDGILRAYAGLYERRRVASKYGEVFRGSEANAIAALALVEISTASASLLSPRDPVAALATLTRRILVREAHAPATDIAGVAWARAYGVLAIHHPPLEQLELVLESGNASGAVAGVYAAAWRALFLASALPLFNWHHRPSGMRQLTRWIEYVAPKAAGLTGETAQPLRTSQAARIAYVLAALADIARDRRLQDAASAIADHATAAQRPDGSIGGEQPEHTTAVAAQVVVAARAVGDEARVNLGLDFLLGRCLEPRRRLLWALADERLELSPWVPLALVAALPKTV